MSHLILFADGTNIFMADHNENNLISNINSELQAISEWFQINRLSLIVDKINFVIRNPNTGHNILMNTDKWHAYKNTASTISQILGVYFDEYLTWSDHTETVMGKVSKTCGILNKLTYRLPQCVLLSIYNSQWHHKYWIKVLNYKYHLSTCAKYLVSWYAN